MNLKHKILVIAYSNGYRAGITSATGSVVFESKLYPTYKGVKLAARTFLNSVGMLDLYDDLKCVEKSVDSGVISDPQLNLFPTTTGLHQNGHQETRHG